MLNELNEFNGKWLWLRWVSKILFKIIILYSETSLKRTSSLKRTKVFVPQVSALGRFHCSQESPLNGT